jgi:hypothetical protein
MMADLPLESLAQRCAEENQKYRHQQSHEPRFCFELLRRALIESTSDALTWVFRIFEGQLRAWVHRHSYFASTDENDEYFVNAAFSNFYFALRGTQFERFSSLPQALAYLKSCVHTAIMQYHRDHIMPEGLLLDGQEVRLSYNPDPMPHLGADELWTHICRLLPDGKDRLLADYTFIQGLKPAQIVKLVSGQWATEREVSVALQRIRRLLRKDGELRQRAGLDPRSD